MIEDLLDAARRTFGEGRDPALVHALAKESGLHVGNVLWALDHVLELNPSREEIATLRGRAPRRASVLVVLAANVFLAPLRAIAWALAEAPRVLVRTSRRAPTFTRALHAAAPHLFELAELSNDPSSDVAALAEQVEAVHVYGTQRTIDAVAARNVPSELHGPGVAAIVASDDAIVSAAGDIALDVAVFDQRGCLSPRLALVIGDASRAADALHRALERVPFPRGEIDRPELTRAREAAAFAGRVLEGSDHLVLDLGSAEGAPFGPTGRVLPVVSVASIDDARARLARVAGSLTAIAGIDLGLGTRVARLGFLQRPPLDGPVDLRVLR